MQKIEILKKSKKDIIVLQDSGESKLEQIRKNGYIDTGKTFKILRGPFKGREFPVYAQEGDYAGLVYNCEEDKIEFVFKLPVPFRQTQDKPARN